jgi:hypothetical protein
MGQLRQAYSRAKSLRPPLRPRRASHALRQAETRKQTALQTIELANPVKLLKASDLGIHLTRPNSTYFKSSYGRWAPLVIYKGTEETALSSNSIRLHLGHLKAVGKFRKFGFFRPLSSVKPRVFRFGAWLAILGLRGSPGGFARELAGLNCPICLRIRLL